MDGFTYSLPFIGMHLPILPQGAPGPKLPPKAPPRSPVAKAGNQPYKPAKDMTLAEMETIISGTGAGSYFEKRPVVEELGTRAAAGDIAATKLLVKALNDAITPIAELAANELSTLVTPETIKIVADAATAGTTDRIRQHATWTIGLMRNTELLPILIENLKHRNPLIVIEAARSIEMVGGDEAAVTALTTLSTAKDSATRSAITDPLGQIDGPISVKTLTSMLTDKDAVVRADAVAGLGRADITELLKIYERILTDKAFEVRIATIRALAENFKLNPADQATWNALAKTILQLLTDKDWQARAWAIDQIRNIMNTYKEAGQLSDEHVDVIRYFIDPLVAELPSETGRLRGSIINILRTLSTIDLGNDPKPWIQWWQDNRDTLVPFKPQVEPTQPAAENKTVVEKAPQFFGLPVASLDVAFVLDFSGSQTKPSENGEVRIDQAIAALKDTIDAMPNGATVTIIIMSTSASGPLRKKTVTIKTPQQRQELIRYLNSVKAQLPVGQGRGDYTRATKEALGLPFVDTVYILSDGDPTDMDYVLQPNVQADIRRANKYKAIQINTVTVANLATKNPKGQPLNQGVANDNMGIEVRR